MKKLVFINLILLISTVSFFCRSPSAATKNTRTTGSAHTSRNSLDWDGIYRGVLPCADCPGIQETVYLHKNGSYKIKIKYLDRQVSAREDSGKFSWNEKGNIINLQENAHRISFLVGENTLTQLDMDGNRMTGDIASMYILSKGR
jgi:uncharacterized lipoprotein NlpE involved in copper resistance